MAKKTTRYETLEEASAAAIALIQKKGLEPCGESYRKCYKDDPMLHSTPHLRYANWSGWSDFLGKKYATKYATLEEASAAAIALLQKKGAAISYPSYAKHYKDDPRLHVRPWKYYTNCIGWNDFIGKETLVVKKYETLEEASAAAIALIHENGLTPIKESYMACFKQDPKLHSSPDKHYTDWLNWNDFLGTEASVEKYTTIEEASAAAIALLQKKGLELTRDSYLKSYKEDPKLPSMPRVFYTKWLGWDKFYGVDNRYPEPNEALSKFKALIGDTKPTKEAYAAIHGMDERLPDDPLKYYDLSNWSSFLCKRFYKTWEEASEAARKLIPADEQTRAGYGKYRHEDPLLHSNPDKHYKDFPCWDVFFGREIVEKYSLDEARTLCRERDLWTRKEYSEYAHNNKRLPSNLYSYYGFDSYDDFLEIKYWSLKDVRSYCKENRITTFREYKKHARNHPKLKVNLDQIEGYKKSEKILWQPSDYQPLFDVGLTYWANLAEEYVGGLKRNVGPTRIRLIHYLLHCLPFISQVDATKNVAPFFERRNEQPSIEVYVSSLAESHQGNAPKNMVVAFLQSVFDKSFYIEDEDTGERTPVPGFGLYRVPYKNVDLSMEQESRSGTNKPDLPFEYVVKAREYLIPEFIEVNGGQVRCESFSHLSCALELNNGDWYEVDKYLIDENDPNCVWRKRKKIKAVSGKQQSKQMVYEMWSPVRTVALYCLLNLPTRGQQILWLDSGEADEFKLINSGFKAEKDDEGKLVKYVPDLQWVRNDNPLAGMQKKNRGVLCKVGEDVHMFTNTNKTGKPFESAYIPTAIIPWIIRLRDWQSKYNPIDKPTRWLDITFPSKKQRPSDAVLKQRGTCCFLFRNPTQSNRSKGAETYQPYNQSIFANALAKTLYEIQDTDFPLAEKVSSQYESKYTPHCMRVTLITSLVLYGDIPLPVLMKVVGHAQVIMTLHYTKITHMDVVQEIQAAEKRAMASSADRKNALRIQDEILSHKADLLIPDGSPLHDPSWPKASISFFDFGLCPFSCTRCHDGGEEREETKNNKCRTEFNPVPAGYLGTQNCFRCRHLVTGATYLGGLVMKGNEIALAQSHCEKQIDKIEDEISELDAQLYGLEVKGVEAPFELTMKQKRLNNQLEQESVHKNMLCCDLICVFRLADEATALLNKPAPANGKVPMVVNHNSEFSGFKLSVGFKEASEYRALAEVCENAEIYVSAKADNAVHQRSQLIDKMLEENNIAPQFFKLNADQQLVLGNHLTQTLVARLGGWGDLDSVMLGERPLDLITNNEDGLTSLSEDVKALLTEATSTSNQLANATNMENRLDARQ